MGVKAQDGGIGRVYVVFAGCYPEAAAEVNGAEVVKPGAHPVVVVQEVFSDGVVVAEGGAQDGEDDVRAAW